MNIINIRKWRIVIWYIFDRVKSPFWLRYVDTTRCRWGIGGGCDNQQAHCRISAMSNMVDVNDVAVNAEKHVVAL